MLSILQPMKLIFENKRHKQKLIHVPDLWECYSRQPVLRNLIEDAPQTTKLMRKTNMRDAGEQETRNSFRNHG